jgi:maleate cis-trans isomerase
MAVAGADVVVLGGNPINQRQGVENLPRITAELSAELGVPVITSTQAQQEALRALGATRVAAGHLAGPEHDERVARQIRAMGVACAGTISHGPVPLLRYATVGESTALDLGRELHRRFSEADALHFPNAHWPTVGAIETLERETGVAVSGAAQAIIWKALRTAGVHDRIEGFGRLLRDA